VGVNVGTLASGLPSALQQAGISGVKIFGVTPDSTAFKELQAGGEAMWITKTSAIAGYTMMDSILRVMDRGAAFDGYPQPMAMLTPATAPKNVTAQPTYPTDYQQDFYKLWHVS
jgi:hypothetical protein